MQQSKYQYHRIVELILVQVKQTPSSSSEVAALEHSLFNQA